MYTDPFLPLGDFERRQVEHLIAEATVAVGAIMDNLSCPASSMSGTVRDATVYDAWFYERDSDFWYGDNGACLTMLWSCILVNTCGFEWRCVGRNVSPDKIVLINPENNALFFPWPEIYTAVYNYGSQSPLSHMWIDYVLRIDRMKVIPKGWHPVVDISVYDDLGWSPEVRRRVRELFETQPRTLEGLGVIPLSWQQSDADSSLLPQLASWAKHLKSHGQ